MAGNNNYFIILFTCTNNEFNILHEHKLSTDRVKKETSIQTNLNQTNKKFG